MTSVSVGRIIVTQTQPVGSNCLEWESNPWPPDQSYPPSKKKKNKKKQRGENRNSMNFTDLCVMATSQGFLQILRIFQENCLFLKTSRKVSKILGVFVGSTIVISSLRISFSFLLFIHSLRL